MEENKVLENLSKSVTERLKIPIIVTYISVLIVYNWDILFYLFFDNDSASKRIETIKKIYEGQYFERVSVCLIIAVVLIVLFTVLNTLLNVTLKWFYRKDKETSSEIENFEKIDSLTTQLSKSVEEVKELKKQVLNLQNINQNLADKNLDINIEDISRKDYNRLLSYLNNKEDKEKLRYSLKELIQNLKDDLNINFETIIEQATYSHQMQELFDILKSRNLIDLKRAYVPNSDRYVNKIFLSKSFEDILKLQ
nr:hypothetical protein [uncultured Allomuricauda sp.]